LPTGTGHRTGANVPRPAGLLGVVSGERAQDIWTYARHDDGCVGVRNRPAQSLPAELLTRMFPNLRTDLESAGWLFASPLKLAVTSTAGSTLDGRRHSPVRSRRCLRGNY
jgi:hypothetical protein